MRSNRLAMAVSAAALLAAAPAFAADTFTIDKNHSNATFKIRHLVGKVPGRFTDIAGTISIDRAKPEASSVEFVIQAKSIDTANPDRDKHLRSADFFDVERFSAITFKSKSVKPLGNNRFDVLGTLEMHGIAKDITLPVSFLGFGNDPWGNERAGFELTTTLNRKDFGILWNQTLDAGGFLLGDDVEVSIGIEAVKQKQK